MNEKPLLYTSLVFSVFGLVLMYSLPPESAYQDASIRELVERCEGYASVSGVLTKAFYSKSNNYIGELSQNRSQIMVMLRDAAVVSGDNIRVRGQLSKFSGTCWLFADRVDPID
jgi:hypothetical protein